MKGASLGHVLKIVPFSVFNIWKIFLPLVTVVTVIYAYQFQYCQQDMTGDAPQFVPQGIVGMSYIVVWFASALVTRVGYPTNWMWLKLLPISITRQLVIIFTEHVGLLLVWVILPVTLLFGWIGQLQSHGWDVLFICMGGNALFGLYITIFNLFSRYTQGKPDLLMLPFLVATCFSIVCLFPFIDELFNPTGYTFIIEIPWDREKVATLGCLITWSLAFISGWIPEKPLQQYRMKPHIKEVPPVLLQSEQILELPPGGMSLRSFINVITKGVGYFFLAMALVVMEPHFSKITGYISDQKFLEPLFSNKLFSFMYHTGVMLVLISGSISYIYFVVTHQPIGAESGRGGSEPVET